MRKVVRLPARTRPGLTSACNRGAALASRVHGDRLVTVVLPPSSNSKWAREVQSPVGQASGAVTYWRPSAPARASSSRRISRTAVRPSGGPPGVAGGCATSLPSSIVSLSMPATVLVPSAALPPDEYPSLTEAREEASRAMGGDQVFEYGLDRILDGLEARLAD